MATPWAWTPEQVLEGTGTDGQRGLSTDPARGPAGLSDTQAVTVSFLTLSIGRLLHALNMRDPDSGIVVNEITRNPWVGAALVVCVALLAVAVLVPPVAGAR